MAQSLPVRPGKLLDASAVAVKLEHPKRRGGRIAALRQQAQKRPICVDLDGTLVNTDPLVEGRVAALQQYRTLDALMLLVPVILFWQCRLWLETVLGDMHDDPIVYTVSDWVSWPLAAAILGVRLAAQAETPFLSEARA